MAWTGTHWAIDKYASADALAVGLAKSYRVPVETGNGGKRLAPDHRACSDAAIKAALRRASKDQRLRVMMSDFDQHPTLLATPSGTVDLKTGLVRPPAPSDLITKRTAVAVDLAGLTPAWNEYLAQVTGRDPAMIAYLQRVAGMALCGVVLDHVLVVVYGPSRSGKSTFLQMLEHVLGDSMATTIPAAMLSARKPMYDSERRYQLAEMRGLRLVTSYESEEGGLLDETAVKTLTSSDPIPARATYGRPFRYRPSHTTLLATNEKPTVVSNDDAIWNRVALVPFLHPRREEEQDRWFVQRLVATEGPGILGWMIRGAVTYLADGLGSCPAVDDATAEYRSEQDLLGQFIADCLVVAAAAKVPQPALTTAWEQWCHRQGMRRSWSLPMLKRRLRERGVLASDAEFRTAGARWLRGIGLQAAEPT